MNRRESLVAASSLAAGLVLSAPTAFAGGFFRNRRCQAATNPCICPNGNEQPTNTGKRASPLTDFIKITNNFVSDVDLTYNNQTPPAKWPSLVLYDFLGNYNHTFLLPSQVLRRKESLMFQTDQIPFNHMHASRIELRYQGYNILTDAVAHANSPHNGVAATGMYFLNYSITFFDFPSGPNHNLVASGSGIEVIYVS